MIGNNNILPPEFFMKMQYFKRSVKTINHADGSVTILTHTEYTPSEGDTVDGTKTIKFGYRDKDRIQNKERIGSVGLTPEERRERGHEAIKVSIEAD